MKIFNNVYAMRTLTALWLCLLFCAAAPVEAATYAYRNDVFAYDTPSAGASSVAWHASGASPGCTAPSPIAEFRYQEGGRQVRVYRIIPAPFDC